MRWDKIGDKTHVPTQSYFKIEIEEYQMFSYVNV